MASCGPGRPAARARSATPSSRRGGVAGGVVVGARGAGSGGGIILDGKLWAGATGGAGEIGHIIIAAGGRGWAAAFGSLESMGQISAITQRAPRETCEGRKSPRR